MKRSAVEVRARCSCILDDESIVSLVKESSSPTAAYEMVFAKINDVSKAKAGRWLAVLRRDYPAEYLKIIKPTTSHAQRGTAK